MSNEVIDVFALNPTMPIRIEEAECISTLGRCLLSSPLSLRSTGAMKDKAEMHRQIDLEWKVEKRLLSVV